MAGSIKALVMTALVFIVGITIVFILIALIINGYEKAVSIDPCKMCEGMGKICINKLN